MNTTLRLLALFSAATAASWAACPAGVTANQLFQSSPWAFQLTSSDMSTAGSATVGMFQPLANGTLKVIQTFSTNLSTGRQAESGGGYFLNPDCSGGLLIFTLNGFAMQLEFVYTNGNQGLVFVTVDMNGGPAPGCNDEVTALNDGCCNTRAQGCCNDCCYNCCGGVGLQGVACDTNATGSEKAALKAPIKPLIAAGVTTTLTGVARRTTLGCPAGLVDRLDLLNNTTWTFRTFAPYYAGTAGATSMGTFTLFNISGSGRLAGSETISYGAAGPIVRQAQISGRYILNADCSGGEIMIMNRGFPLQYLQMEFFFAGPNFSQMYMLNDSVGDGLAVVAGIAKKQ